MKTTFMTICHSILIRMRNFTDKIVEKKHTSYVQYFFPRQSCRLRDNVEKYCRAGQATVDNVIPCMHIEYWIPRLKTHICNI